jgi:hypothetical protein
MNSAAIFLGLGVVTSGLFSGLLVAVLALLQQILKGLSGREFTVVMQRFLPLARRAPVNYTLVLTSVVAPLTALLLGIGPIGSPRFVLTLAGMLVFLLNPLLTSTFAAEPLYNVILGWHPATPPADWERSRERYFRVNWLRLSGSLLSFLLLLAALALPGA